MIVEVRRSSRQIKSKDDRRDEFDLYVDGVEVFTHPRKWIVEAVAEAIRAGHISIVGDVMISYCRWAIEHDRASYDRLPENL